jgi:hypothetical protein
VSAVDPIRTRDDRSVDDFHGHDIRRLANEHLWIDVLANAGPRIVRLGLAGSTANILAETPSDGWDTPHGRYELYGGHRLWFAPEDPDRVAVPDGHGLVIEPEAEGIRLTGLAEAPTGLIRSMTVRLDPTRAALEVRHGLENVGVEPLELAPWSITQLPLGGTVLLPQRPAILGHHVHPNRTLVLWPYTSWEDPRFRPRDGLLTLDALAGPDLKLGYFNDAGWVAYVRDDASLVRRFEPLPGQPHPDMGCNVEVYVGDRYLELELLGPLATLAPGSTVTLVERWEIGRLDALVHRGDVRAMAARIAPNLPVAGATAKWLQA